MHRLHLFYTVLFSFIFTLVACNGGPTESTATPTSPAVDNILVLGDISDEPVETIRGTQPMADYLAANLAEFGVTSGEVKVAPDLETMSQWMATGEVDIYFDSPYPVLVISEQTGAQPVLRRLRFGVSEYHSIFVTRADSSLTSMADLPGQMVAFEEVFSTSGYFLPLSFLLENGFNPVAKETPDSAVSADEVGYVFSSQDDNTVQWVVSGRVPVGVIDNVSFGRLPAETQAELKIIAETEDVPRQMVLLRPEMDATLVEAIKILLLEMDETAEGAAALEAFQTTEFTEFPEGVETVLARMRTLYELIQEQN